MTHLSAEKRLFRAAFFSSLTFFMVMSIRIFYDVDNEELLTKEMQSLTLLVPQDQSTMDDFEQSHHHRNLTHRNFTYGNLTQRNFTHSNFTHGNFTHSDFTHRNFTDRPSPLNKTSNDEFSKAVLSSRSFNDYLKQKVATANEKQTIRNLDKFDLNFDESAVVIVVQVHNRSDYLRHLVDSLSRSKDIGDVLLIFSHDVYSIELNEIIEKIDFCLVMQIFYPFSIQLHSREFPGDDPKDCPKTASKESALKMGCQNAANPDRFGHYREATFTQPKHHWFWKVNHVFDHLNVTKYFEGLVLFLEDDHYAVDDFLHVLKLAYRQQKQLCADCRILTLGGYDEKLKKSEDLSQADVTYWMTSKHNIGMAFDRRTWQEIKPCGNLFCDFDDYNWDWSLLNIGANCLPSHLKALVVRTPRIRHIGQCGMHIKKSNCSPLEKIHSIRNMVQNYRPHFFPDRLRIGQISTQQVTSVKMNGGWGDPRDRRLCKSFMNISTH